MIDIQLGELPFIPFQARQTLPECSAVYFMLTADGEVEYIGGTVNLNKRFIRHHRRTQFELLRIAWIATSKAELRAIEKAAIQLFQPRLNSTKSPDCAIMIRCNKALIARLRQVSLDVDRPVSQIVREAVKKELDLLSKRSAVKSPLAR